MSNFNHFPNRPRLVWDTQPETKIRFRYESEGGSHGGLAGKTGKKTYPTLKLENYNGRKPIVVRVSLYTEDKKPHVLEFKGKKNETNKPYLEEKLQDDNTVVFKNIHILSKKKDVIEKILMERKLNNLKDGMSCAARAQFEKKYSKDVKDRARAILNSVRLYFEAFEMGRPNAPLCCLYSDVICNQKAASKGDLRICRLSCVTGSWKGGDEVILLCEKVQKDNIKVKFFEMDNDGAVIWQDYGAFSPLDVHYQVAIPFKTPAYVRNEEKRVFICLERNEETSEAREFTYKPDEPSSKKRKLDESEMACPDTPDSLIDETKYQSYPSSDFVTVVTSGGISGFKSEDSQEIDMNFSLADINNCFGLLDDNKDFGLPFDDLLDDSVMIDGGSDGVFGGPFVIKEKSQIWHPEDTVCSEITVVDYIDGPKIPQILKNESQEFIDMDVVLRNITLEDDEEQEKDIPEKFVRKDHSQNSSSDLQHKKKIYSRLLLKRDEFGNTLLHKAVLLNRNIVPILKMSLFVKIDLVSAQNHKNQTALHIATEANRCEVVKILLKCGSNPNIKDFKGNSCYFIAAHNNFAGVLREINRFSRFQHKVCDFNDEGLTAFHVAIMRKNPDVFDFMKIHMTDPNIAEKKAGKSLLHYAVEFQPSILTKLLEMPNINVNVQDFEGNTPLHIACACEKIEAVRKLIYSGADPSIKNFKQNFNFLEENIEDEMSNGQLPADMTTNLEILELLRSAMQEVIVSLHIQDSVNFQESHQIPCQMTEELCKYLDEQKKWEKLVPFFLDENVTESLILGSSPSKALLTFVKKEEPDNYVERLKTVLEIVDLKDGVDIINQYVNKVN